MRIRTHGKDGHVHPLVANCGVVMAPTKPFVVRGSREQAPKNRKVIPLQDLSVPKGNDRSEVVKPKTAHVSDDGGHAGRTGHREHTASALAGPCGWSGSIGCI